MKFTDGFWQLRPGVTALYAQEAYDIWETDAAADGAGLVITAPTAVISKRGDVLNRAALTVTLSSPLEGVVRVRISHHQGSKWHGGFDLPGAAPTGAASVTAEGGTLTTGRLTARIAHGAPWSLDFEVDGTRVTGSGHKSQGYIGLSADAQVDGGVVGNGRSGSAAPTSTTFVHEQLDLGVGELIYGLGERFGPLVKNGQSVDIWNADGGTSSEQAYKNVPFYLSNRGYGVLVNDPGHVSFEIGSESVERVQFSVAGEELEYFVIAGPHPKDVLERYTALTGRPADRAGVVVRPVAVHLVHDRLRRGDGHVVHRRDGRARAAGLGVPLRLLLDARVQLVRLRVGSAGLPRPGRHARAPAREGSARLRVDQPVHRAALAAVRRGCGRRLSREAARRLGVAVGSVAGRHGRSSTSPTPTRPRGSSRSCGRSSTRASTASRPTSASGSRSRWSGSTAPTRRGCTTSTRSCTTRPCYDVLVDARGEGDAVLFARSATAGGQSMPVHWGGDSTSTFESMAETLRGGLSLALSGFAHWSHDIGGFEGTPDAAVFKRWTAFGLLGSHSRFHGSGSYRVPWAFDEEAVEVTRIFTHLKMRLMPYLFQAGVEAAATGARCCGRCSWSSRTTRASATSTGSTCSVATSWSPRSSRPPVTSSSTCPRARGRICSTGEEVQGGSWRRERHGFTSLPIYVRPGGVLPWGARQDRPDYDYLDGLTLRVFAGGSGSTTVTVTNPDGRSETFDVDRAAVTG